MERVETGEGGGNFFVASPVKALADYVYVHQCDWASVHPLIESLRIFHGLGRFSEGLDFALHKFWISPSRPPSGYSSYRVSLPARSTPCCAGNP